jgi:hypothetical protein
MQHDPAAQETSDENYFASFTDMLTGILFIFIILLMIAANNYQEAMTPKVVKKKNVDVDMVAKINQAHEKALDQARTDDLKKTEENLFFETRKKILQTINQALNQQGVPATVDVQQGVLRIPDSIIFNPGSNQITPKGKLALANMAWAFGSYLPCVTPTNDAAKLAACGPLNLPATGNTALDGIVIKTNPNVQGGVENKWLLSVEQSIAILNGLIANNTYLDADLKNTAGAPILNANADKQKRLGKAGKPVVNVNQSVEFWFSTRPPNPTDLQLLRIQQDVEKAPKVTPPPLVMPIQQ